MCVGTCMCVWDNMYLAAQQKVWTYIAGRSTHPTFRVVRGRSCSCLREGEREHGRREQLLFQIGTKISLYCCRAPGSGFLCWRSSRTCGETGGSPPEQHYESEPGCKREPERRQQGLILCLSLLWGAVRHCGPKRIQVRVDVGAASPLGTSATMSSDGMGAGAAALPHSDGTGHLQGAALTPRAHAGVGEVQMVEQPVAGGQACAGLWREAKRERSARSNS